MDDQDSSIDVLECIHIVNLAISVMVIACKGVDVTPEKLARKYVEVYMALDIALRRVSSIRLSAMLSWMHEEEIAKMLACLGIAFLRSDHQSRVILHQHEPHGSSTAAFFTPRIEDIGPNTEPWDFCTSVYQYCAITQLFTGHVSILALAAVYIENSDIVSFSFGAWVACMVWVSPSVQKMSKGAGMRSALQTLYGQAVGARQLNMSEAMKVYPFLATVTTFQFAYGPMIILLMGTFKLHQRPKITCAQLAAILPLAVAHTMGNLLTNISLGKVAVSFTHTIKAMEPFVYLGWSLCHQMG
ncbi:hypothetical protein SAY86_028546 [Trapa natans]|uniref:Sugar phosphate transporter domain-containing protein n=1 Tax=Trapa natans TaxID=22666 RepID=A0AAN7RCB2_TRANT|nr:hypothetical protein SAY86_028546 [Trapa natans]